MSEYVIVLARRSNRVSIWRMLNTWLTNGDEALQCVWGLVSIDGVAEEWTA
jgi:predicted solute-binding protein